MLQTDERLTVERESHSLFFKHNEPQREIKDCRGAMSGPAHKRGGEQMSSLLVLETRRVTARFEANACK